MSALTGERGLVTWLSSDEDGGPDCGIVLGLGGGVSLFIGELSNQTVVDQGVDTANPSGWWIALYSDKDGFDIVGQPVDSEAARRLHDAVLGAIHG